MQCGQSMQSLVIGKGWFRFNKVLSICSVVSQCKVSRLPCFVFYICLLTYKYHKYKSVELGDQLMQSMRAGWLETELANRSRTTHSYAQCAIAHGNNWTFMRIIPIQCGFEDEETTKWILSQAPRHIADPFTENTLWGERRHSTLCSIVSPWCFRCAKKIQGVQRIVYMVSHTHLDSCPLSPKLDKCICKFVPLCICKFVYLCICMPLSHTYLASISPKLDKCICVFINLCICVFLYHAHGLSHTCPAYIVP